jgi:DNA-binding NarL/FixJ family response regulator
MRSSIFRPGGVPVQATEVTSVVVAESKEVMRLGQQQMAASAGHFDVVGAAGDVESLMKIVRETKPSIVVLNDRLSGAVLSATVHDIRTLSPSTSVIVTLSSPSGFWTALEAKAQAYCDREGTAEHFKASLNAVSQGQCYIAPTLSQYLLQGDGYKLLQNAIPRSNGNTPSALDSLSRREREVIGLLSEGHSNERIANALGLSIQTVKVHVKHILKKLQVSDRTQAVIKALKHG